MPCSRGAGLDWIDRPSVGLAIGLMTGLMIGLKIGYLADRALAGRRPVVQPIPVIGRRSARGCCSVRFCDAAHWPCNPFLKIAQDYQKIRQPNY